MCEPAPGTHHSSGSSNQTPNPSADQPSAREGVPLAVWPFEPTAADSLTPSLGPANTAHPWRRPAALVQVSSAVLSTVIDAIGKSALIPRAWLFRLYGTRRAWGDGVTLGVVANENVTTRRNSRGSDTNGVASRSAPSMAILATARVGQFSESCSP